mgnify:FL=1
MRLPACSRSRQPQYLQSSNCTSFHGRSTTKLFHTKTQPSLRLAPTLHAVQLLETRHTQILHSLIGPWRPHLRPNIGKRHQFVLGAYIINDISISTTRGRAGQFKYNCVNMSSLQGIQEAATAMGVALMSQVFRFSITEVPATVIEWIAAHPGQTALLAVNGVVIFTPAALTAPLLATMGFGASGPVAGE